MRGVGGRKGLVASSSLVVFIFGGAGAHARPSESGPVARESGERARLEDRVPELKQARAGARRLLADPRCLAVLADFESVNGGRLDLVLRASRRTAQEQLDQLSFESGFGRAGCRRGTAAFTRIHSSVVSVCLRPFTLLPPVEQQAVLIHEMLHSLGLGENPPESVAITEQVLKRCGIEQGAYRNPSAR